MQPTGIHAFRRGAGVLRAQLCTRDDAPRRPFTELYELGQLLLAQRQAAPAERFGSEVDIPREILVGYHLAVVLRFTVRQLPRRAHHHRDVAAPPAESREIEELEAIREPPRILDHENGADRKSTRLNSSHVKISYAVFCLKKKK